MPEFTAIRPPAVAGQFYPEDSRRLADAVQRALNAAPKEVAREPVRAIIAPHAGYEFSARTAAQAYKLLSPLAGRVKRVVILAPSHRTWLRGVSIGDYAAYETPLGAVDVDVETCRGLLTASELVSANREAHAGEHSLEVHLPFVQALLPDAQLVPIVCGDMDRAALREVAGVLHTHAWNDDTVWIVSSDFTHFGRSFGYMPFRDNIAERLSELDKGATAAIEALDTDGFLEYIDRTGATICGRMPIALLLSSLERERADYTCRLLHYTTSGALTHDYSHTVSYAALAVFGGEPAATGNAVAKSAAAMLSDADKDLLLRLAREAVKQQLEQGRVQTAADEAQLPERLREKGACFVTLHKDGQLRGCIGSLEATEPLYRNVIHNARNAAFHDPRFRPVQRGELDALDVEISVLTPAVPVSAPDDIVLGKHGIILEKNGHRAVFLPQVAPEQGWDLETTLTHLAMKAGLRPGAWRSDVSFEVFEAIVFGTGDS